MCVCEFWKKILNSWLNDYFSPIKSMQYVSIFPERIIYLKYWITWMSMILITNLGEKRKDQILIQGIMRVN